LKGKFVNRLKSPDGWWPIGTEVVKTKGSSWRGRVVGYYSTDQTKEGYAVESEFEPGSVQIYPKSALMEKKV
jgi:hypothetical protein